MSSATESATPSLVSELNLAHYVDLLKRRWFWIVACGLVGAGIAYFWANSATPVYTARTELAILRTGSIVNFDPRFRTISDADPNATALDAVARRQSLLSIGESPALAEQVIQKLGDQLPPPLRTVEAMLGAVSIINDGDILRVSAETGSPTLSALITNAWGEAYVARVNQVFSDSGLASDNLQSIALELKKDYEAKQDAVTRDRATSEIQRVLREKDFVERQLNVNLQEKLVRGIDDATALRELVANSQADDATASQQAAMLILQVNLFKTTDTTPNALSIPITADTTPRPRSELLQELDNLIANLKERRAAQIAERDALYDQLRSLRVEQEATDAKTKYLEWSRDLAWNTYQLMAGKVTENAVASETQSKLVQVAAPAVAPTQPRSQQRQLKTILGGLVGLLVGATLAVVIKPR